MSTLLTYWFTFVTIRLTGGIKMMNQTQTKMKTQDLVQTALMSALIAVGAFITVPLGPVPFTMQNFFVFMAGLLLVPKLAGLSVLTYVLVGLIGLPVFAGFTGGPQMVLAPTFGFLIAFILGAMLISKLAYGEKSFIKILAVLILAEVVFYAIGLPYMYMVLTRVNGTPMTFQATLTAGMIPFLGPDLLKAVLAAFIAPKILTALNRH